MDKKEVYIDIIGSTCPLFPVGSKYTISEMDALFKIENQKSPEGAYRKINYLISNKNFTYKGTYVFGYSYQTLLEDILKKEKAKIKVFSSNKKLFIHREGKEKVEEYIHQSNYIINFFLSSLK